MGRALTELVLGVYGLVGVTLILSGLSRIFFGKKGLKGFLQSFSFAVVWPLAMLSEGGRVYINKTMKEWK